MLKRSNRAFPIRLEIGEMSDCVTSDQRCNVDEDVFERNSQSRQDAPQFDERIPCFSRAKNALLQDDIYAE